MDTLETSLEGVLELRPELTHDQRGTFIKTFHRPMFEENGLHCDYPEEYYSLSKKGVLRGLHFQTPPLDHIKIVYCAYGTVLDAVVDLRVGSPDYGNHFSLELSAEHGKMLYIPAGFAHGFFVISSQALMFYKTSTTYSKEHDLGILWNSVDIPWPTNNPILSERDKEFPALCDFNSPFVYGINGNGQQ